MPMDVVPVRPPRWGVVSTYPPTACGLATFTQSLVTGLAGLRVSVDVVQVLDAPLSKPRCEVSHQLVNGAPGAVAAAAAVLNGYDVVVLQHEYGIYGGVDGEEVLALLARLHVPVITVLHTVLTDPSPNQHRVLQAVATRSDVLVTMTRTARSRLIESYDVDARTVQVIPHGAADALVARPSPSGARPAPTGGARQDGITGWQHRRPSILTWGLLGQGKGIEWGVEALAGLTDLDPAPVYVVAGQTHPRVLAHEGERYRRSVQSRARALGVADDVVFDDRYLTADQLHRLVRSADVVLLPYDSREQVTSGVLIEAVAAGKPVISTRFPHAVELLAGGAGLLVGQRDPLAITAAIRRVLTEPGQAARMSAAAETLAPELSWRSVAGRYLATGNALSRGGDGRAVVGRGAQSPVAVVA